MIGKRWLLIAPLLLSGCATVTAMPCAAPVSPSPEPVAWLVDQGWHTAIGLPVDEITGPLAVFKTILPDARVLMFGFGKRSFITAKKDSLGELLMGPIPGPGAIQVNGLRVPPAEAYAGAQVTRLSLGLHQADRLSAFIWDALGKTPEGQARLISRGVFPGDLFYASRRGYAPYYTCNSWSADALQAAGLPIDPAGIMLPGGLIEQASHLPNACEIPVTHRDAHES